MGDTVRWNISEYRKRILASLRCSLVCILYLGGSTGPKSTTIVLPMSIAEAKNFAVYRVTSSQCPSRPNPSSSVIESFGRQYHRGHQFPQITNSMAKWSFYTYRGSFYMFVEPTFLEIPSRNRLQTDCWENRRKSGIPSRNPMARGFGLQEFTSGWLVDRSSSRPQTVLVTKSNFDLWIQKLLH